MRANHNITLKGEVVKIENKLTYRIFIEREKILHKLCQIFFRQKDASIYIIPYAKNNKYYMGVNSFEGTEITGNFDLGKHPKVDQNPHLSIHENGQIHVRSTEGSLAGPVMVKKPSLFCGEHIASVTPDSFEALPIQIGEPKKGKTIQNITIMVKPTESSRRIIVCMNGREPKFKFEPKYFHFLIPLTRPTLTEPLYIGIFSIGQDHLNAENVAPGITVIAGWNPGNPVDFLSIRGK